MSLLRLFVCLVFFFQGIITIPVKLSQSQYHEKSLIFPCFHDEIVKYANKYQVCPALLASIILIESNCKIDAVGLAGEKGLGQIREEIWGEFLEKNKIEDIRGVDAVAAILSYHVKKWGMTNGVERYNGRGKKAEAYRIKVLKKRLELLSI